MITTEGLSKQFHPRKGETITAVSDLTLNVKEGEVFGFLGPNGAGKTTTVRMLASLIAPTGGRAAINGYALGKDDASIRRTIGILTETPGMYDRLSAERNLTIFARLYGVADPAAQVQKYLRMLGLWERRFDPVGSFSKGMRQKLAIARALIHEPRVLVLDEPTSGRAWVNGHEVGKDDQNIRRTVGILTESPGMYDRLSAEKNLTIYARLYEVRDVKGQVEKYLRMLGLWNRRDDVVGNFSKGMKQKRAICRALLHEPEMLFLDEPTSGLDPEASKLVNDFIRELKTEGRTIFINTHNLDEADRLCDRIGVMKQRLLIVDSPENLRKRLYGLKTVFHLKKLPPAAIDMVRALPFARDVQSLTTESGDKLVVALDDPENQNPIVIRKLVESGLDIQFVGELRHSLEEIYLSLIQNKE